MYLLVLFILNEEAKPLQNLIKAFLKKTIKKHSV